MMKHLAPSTRILLAAVLPLLVAGCGALNWDFLNRGKSEKQQPALLQEFTPEADIYLLWHTDVGAGAGHDGRLQPAIAKDVIYAASAKGRLTALERHSGRTLWRVQVADALSGGVGIGPGILLVAGPNGGVFALDPMDGALLWESALNTVVLASPATDGEIVVVRTASGKLHGLDAEDGEPLWVYSSPLPLLTLHGTSAPLVQGGWVMAGFDNGQVAALDLKSGEEQWRLQLARPEGSSVVERLVDIDGDLLVVDERLYAVGFQGQAGMMAWQRGRWIWQQPASSYVAPVAGLGSMYVVGERGRLSALDRDTGTLRWESNVLSLRELSAPAAFLSYLAVGDFEGYCHLFSQVDGHMVARVRHGRDKIRMAPLAVDDVLYVLGEGGRLAAYQVQAP